MAKNIRLRVKEVAGFEIYHPETNVNQVVADGGKTLKEVLVDATTATKGLVKLTTSTVSTDVTTAATPKSVKDALDAAKTHADTKVAALVNNAPTTLDTLAEIATAITETDGAVSGILTTIGTKANTTDLTTHAALAATAASLGHVKTGTNIVNTSGVISVADGTTAVKGVVQLTTGTASTSVTTAATPKSVKDALDAAKAHTDTKVAALVDSSPATLDTLSELAKALGDDPNFATTVANQIGTKVDKVAGKQLSTEDFTAAEKTKLAGIAAEANKYVHPTTAGNKHIPTGGTVGQVLTNSASGTAVWSDPSSTASAITVTDAGGYFEATDTEGVMQEIGQLFAGVRTSLTASMIGILGG